MHGKILEVNNPEQVLQITKALSSESRMRILELLKKKKLNLNSISQELDMPAPSVTVNVKKLEEAGLIETEYKPGDHGSQKICWCSYDGILLQVPGSSEHNANVVKVSMPIGSYKDFSAKPTCGLASEEGFIGVIDEEGCFLEPGHIHAQLLWFRQGHLRYTFPNDLPAGSAAKKLELTMEICSEAPLYDEDQASDITVWVNNKEIGTWTCPSDFGQNRGKLNPEWWNPDFTQHGLLKIWSVGSDGSYLDGKRLSDITLEDLELTEREPIDIKIGVKEDARNVGGLNLFGRKFGNYEQDLVLYLEYEYD